MIGVPQYVVESREDGCIIKARSAPITVDYRAADIRTLATKCCYAVTGGELQVWRVLVRGCVASLAEGLHSLEIVGCSGARVRNKNVPGFTTDYEDLMKRPPQLAVLS